MSNVIIADSDIYVVEPETLQKLHQLAEASPLKRSRICLHRTSDDPIQEMLIAFHRDSYVRVHRHRNKSESFHVLEGILQVVFFDDQGQETRRVRLGPVNSGLPSVYRLACDAWHTVLVETEWAILHETTNGPFVPGDADFADWAPDGQDGVTSANFLNALRTEAALPTPFAGSFGEGRQPRSFTGLQTAAPRAEAGTVTLTTIICNYNHGRFISRAIEAMLTQSRPADEFIIVDDGSTDDSLSVIRSWIQRAPQIRLLINDRNIGFHATFQRAITEATSDFVYSGAADDCILPGFFEGAMKLAQQYPTTGIISGAMISVDPAGHRLGTFGISKLTEPVYLDRHRYLHEILQREPATLSLSAATIFRRQPLLEIGGCPAELGSWGDTFAIQTLGLRHGFCYWPFPAMEWTILPGSLSGSTRSDPLKAMRMLERAVHLMHSEPFRRDFPSNYVDNWSRRFMQSIVHEQLSSAIEGNQTFQLRCREVADSAGFPMKVVLKGLGFVMRCCYFITFRLMRWVVARQLRTKRGQTNPQTEPQ